MKVFNLCCAGEHRFEGWFASAHDYDSQLREGLLECPICGSREVRKLLSAPRLNLSGHRAALEPAADADARPAEEQGPKPDAPASGPGALTAQQMHAMWMKLARHLIETTEDVGTGFAEEARRIHYDEAPQRNIRGTASQAEREALEDEGIDVFTFPLPQAIKGPIQ